MKDRLLTLELPDEAARLERAIDGFLAALDKA